MFYLFLDCLDKQLPIQYDFKFFECISSKILQDNRVDIYNDQPLMGKYNLNT